MKMVKCASCGASDMVEINGYWVCSYCQSKFAIESSNVPQDTTSASFNADIERLLKKCKDNPKRAKDYANLILLFYDPTNKEALKYLQ